MKYSMNEEQLSGEIKVLRARIYNLEKMHSVSELMTRFRLHRMSCYNVFCSHNDNFKCNIILPIAYPNNTCYHCAGSMNWEGKSCTHGGRNSRDDILLDYDLFRSED